MDLPRFDVFFEIHGMDTTLREPQYNKIQPGDQMSFVDFCKTLPKVYMQEKRDEYPGNKDEREPYQVSVERRK